MHLHNPPAQPFRLARAVRHGLAILGCLALALSPLASQAQSSIPTVQVQLPAGASGTTLQGTLKGRNPDARDYVLSARAGQTMTVTMQTRSSSAHFNVLPPGSEQAIFAGEASGERSWTGVLPTNGQYTIRVYLNRGASRRGVTASYTLKLHIGGDVAATIDAKVAGTPYHATGPLPCTMGKALAACEFGVIRKGADRATVVITPKNGLARTLEFAGQRVTASDGSRVAATKRGDEWEVEVNDHEHYRIPDAVINGG